MVSSVERVSEHPLAAAIVSAAEREKLSPQSVEEIPSDTREAARKVNPGQNGMAGSAKFLKERGVQLPVGKKMEFSLPERHQLPCLRCDRWQGRRGFLAYG